MLIVIITSIALNAQDNDITYTNTNNSNIIIIKDATIDLVEYDASDDEEFERMVENYLTMSKEELLMELLEVYNMLSLEKEAVIELTRKLQDRNNELIDISRELELANQTIQDKNKEIIALKTALDRIQNGIRLYGEVNVGAGISRNFNTQNNEPQIDIRARGILQIRKNIGVYIEAGADPLDEGSISGGVIIFIR